MSGYSGVKVFSATKFRDRDALGERVTDWLQSNSVEVVDTVITQSSDAEYHCLTIPIFYN